MYMSSLLVEVCRIENIKPHPYADRLFLAYVKGWQTAIRKLADGKPEFNVGDLVVYFPPDSVLPQKLAHSPTDNPPGRLGIVNFLGLLDKNEEGIRPPGYKVKALEDSRYKVSSIPLVSNDKEINDILTA